MRKDLVGFDRLINNPLSIVRDFDRDLSRLFDTFYSPSNGVGFSAACDLLENEKSYILTLDVPGVDKKDIAIEYEDGKLTVSGERKTENETATYRERGYGRFSRSIHLGNGVDQDKIDAKYDNGVLTITVPKSEEKIARKIQIS